MPSDISPFFEAGSPPPPFPIPTCQTNLADFISPVVHLAHTVLTPRTKARHNGIVHVFSPPNPGRSSHAGRALPAVIGQGQFIPKTIERTPTATSAEGTDSDLTSLSESSSNRSTPTPAPASAPGRLVCKPKGEVGHPGRGGYTLKKAVDFDSGTLRKIQKHVQELCDQYLDTTQGIKAQSPNRLREVRDEARREFPDLERYEDLWPVDAIVLSHLKRTSRTATLRRQKKG